MTKFFEECLVTEMRPHMFDIMLGTADADFYGHQSQHGSFVFGSVPVWKNRLINRLTICAQHRLLLQQDAACDYGIHSGVADTKIVRTWG